MGCNCDNQSANLQVMNTLSRSAAGTYRGASASLELQGRISSMKIMHAELNNGVTVTAPEAVLLKQGSLGNIGDILDIVCKLTGWCGGGGGGGGDGCTTITIQNPDGSSTTIKQCPKKVGIA